VGFNSTAATSAEIPPGGASKFGLFSIRERMTALGGSFDMRSAPGQGTTATLILPVSPSSP
jgi:signal transduction histidine kinase